MMVPEILFVAVTFPAICLASEVHLYINPSESPCPYAKSCLTLEQFSETASLYSDSSNTSLTLELLPGSHSLLSSIMIQNIASLKLFSHAKNVNVMCANFRLISVAIVQLTNLTFQGCGRGNLTSINKESAALHVVFSNLNIEECKFHRSNLLVIYAQDCNIKIYKSEFINSSRGVLYTVRCNIADNGSYYYGNSVAKGGTMSAILSLQYGYSKFNSCRFNRNGPLLFAISIEVVLNMCECTKNMASLDSLRVIAAFNTRIILENSNFCGNIGLLNALYILSSNVTLKNATIIENEAHIGPVLGFRRSTLVTYNVTIAGNTPWNNSVSTSFEDGTKSNITGKLIFMNNYGFLLISNSEVTFLGEVMFQNNSFIHSQPSTSHEGGAIVCIGSTVRFVNSTKFLDNYSRKNGGALTAIGSKIYASKSIVLANNRAQNNGGGIYLFVSHFICNISCNFSGNNAITGDGGGIHAVESIVYFGGERSQDQYYSPSNVLLTFRRNLAVHGGGIYFETNSELRGPKDSNVIYKIIFDNNYALKEGKAIYVDDSTYLTTCSQHQAQCFLQALPPNYVWLDKNLIKIMGDITKTTIFGGQLDKCIVNNIKNSMNGIEYLESVMGGQDITQMITSNPVRICYCNGTEPNCQLQAFGTPNIIVQKGKSFNVSVTALDQVNDSVSASVSSNLAGYPAGSHLGNSQNSREIPARCTNLTFNVYSLNDVETLHIVSNNRCNKNNNNTLLTVSIILKACTCPVGFHLENSIKTSCKCECDPRIKPYKEQCNLTKVVKSKESQAWIMYSNDTGFLFHPFCPYDFCLPPTTPVIIDLCLLNGSDAQCASNRIGLLCGKCKPGYSLSLSSSHCLECPEINWPWALLIITVKIIAGIVLIATILILNLTVSIGTLNGLIFYANVFAADSSLFLSFTEQNFFTIFLAWLNLDLGFDVCYFKGIDAITKAWLNILFPLYVITVLLLIILISKYSSCFGEFIGRWNPVATLATLLLLSYTRLLRTIITVLSFTIIIFRTGQYYEHKAVWLQDASVNFFSVKHFPLGILAIAIVISGLFYTVLLFSWQWLLQLPNRQIFKWVRNTRLNLFMEANLAPYKAKYRYWYGLLLFVRMALYLGIATETSHDSVTIILVIGLIAASILLLRTFLGNNIYRNRFIGYLNSSFYYNLLSLSLARLYCQNSSSCQERSSKISIALAFILFIFILTYHILRALLEVRRFRYLMASIEETLNLRKLRIRLIDHDDPRFKKIQESVMQKARVVIPTSTEVALSPSKHSTDDEASSKNMRKFSPDEGYCLRSMMQESDCTPAEQLSVAAAGEEIVLNDSLNKESVCKQKTHHKSKRWTDSSTLREPLLQD